MKIIILLLLIAPFCYATEPVSLKIFVEGCEKESNSKGVVTTHCESYLFGFLDSAKLSLLANNNDCMLPYNAKDLLSKLKQAMAANQSLGTRHYNAAIWEVLNGQCKVSH